MRWLYWKKKLERARWFQWTALVAIALPYIAATAGWILTEMGRQPWIVQDLLKTSEANSPSVSTTWLGISLGVFVTPLRRPPRRRLRADAPLRASGPAGCPQEQMPAPAVTY